MSEKKSQPMWCHDVFNESERERERKKREIFAASRDVEKCNKFKYRGKCST